MAGGFGFFDQNGESEKDFPEKRGFIVFFELFFRKFTRLIQVNLLYIAFCIPYLFILYWFSPINTSFFKMLKIAEISQFLESLPIDAYLMFEAFLRFAFAFLVITLWGAGPVSAGYLYILRNYARQEHAWIWSDFWQHLRQNFIQGLVVLIFDVVIIAASVFGFVFYAENYAVSGSVMARVAQGAIIVLLLLYTIMHYYIYQLMVTFKSRLYLLFKTSFTLAVLKLPQNLMLTIIGAGGLLYILYSLEWIAIFLCIVILITLINFMNGFYATGVIKKYVIDDQDEID